jgi:uncharacterized protein (TIGR02646 family)
VIPITRLREPAKLSENKEKWLAAYLKRRQNKPGLRPNSRQYGHPEIRSFLEAMSFNKCFYCERKLDETGSQIDHYIEVAENPTLAFDWRNLYLSCPDCNRKKLPNTTIPVSDCLDPCDPSENPIEHLTFDREVIRPKTGSLKGSKTVQKYRLDRENLNYLRLRHLQKFRDVLLALKEHQIRDGGRPLTQLEKEALVSFKEPQHVFSLMFSVYLVKLEL